MRTQRRTSPATAMAKVVQTTAAQAVWHLDIFLSRKSLGFQSHPRPLFVKNGNRFTWRMNYFHLFNISADMLMTFSFQYNVSFLYLLSSSPQTILLNFGFEATPRQRRQYQREIQTRSNWCRLSPHCRGRSRSAEQAQGSLGPCPRFRYPMAVVRGSWLLETFRYSNTILITAWNGSRRSPSSHFFFCLCVLCTHLREEASLGRYILSCVIFHSTSFYENRLLHLMTYNLFYWITKFIQY